jgi:Fic family protein
MNTHIFNNEQLKKSEQIINSPYAKFSLLSSEEIKDLAVAWCYYSGKIEGNTYTYIETDVLLRTGIAALKKYEDAKMLKNLYNAFISLVETIKKEKALINIDKRIILTIHSLVSDGLVDSKNKGTFRTMPVKITGTDYIPPKDENEISENFNAIINNQKLLVNPLEQAVYLHCNIAKLQPFIDGNKRTSRLLESVVMMNSDITPVFSAKEEDIVSYRTGILHFYESNDYSKYVDYFLNRQLKRLQDVTPSEKH